MISTGRITITDVPAQICTTEMVAGGHTVTITNLSHNNSVYIDGEHVTAQNGYELIKRSTITIPMNPEDCLYAVCATGETAELTFVASHR